MRYKVRCRLAYSLPSPSTFVFNVAPPDTMAQTVETESLTLEPDLPVREFRDAEAGNRYHRLEASAGTLVVDYRATVRTEPVASPREGIPATRPSVLSPHVMPYLVPSRHSESDLVMRLAWREFGALPETIERPVRIAQWIHDNVDYLVGTTHSATSAFNTLTSRAGVCRDFAHLGIAFCRALNIPARFVSAYSYDLRPPDFHAVFEAWLDGRWYLFDPTGLASPGGLVRIGTGRDAADVSFSLIFGPAILNSMAVTAEPCDSESAERPQSWSNLAISSA